MAHAALRWERFARAFALALLLGYSAVVLTARLQSLIFATSEKELEWRYFPISPLNMFSRVTAPRPPPVPPTPQPTSRPRTPP